jgi:chromosome segregation protein
VLKARASQEALLNARAHYESEQARLLEAEQALKAARRDETGLADALVQGRMELQRLELERQTLLEGVLERHDILLGDIVGDYHDRPVPTAAAIAEQAELERSIKAMGPINLTAIEECAEVEARYSFLSGQRDDLQAALEALRLAITRINRASKERFKEAFEAVNSMFQKIYPRLFRGGEARLELVGSEDLLEAGVDIIAMPPGKKLQSVGLLSGGEKALTATALVFAIFLIKPSPFCVLDEVDAPLDEANVGRFNEMLREISQVSQFIVITHNKQTMLQMDRLYGITMEEPGMSKVVTVDQDDRQKDQAA